MRGPGLPAHDIAEVSRAPDGRRRVAWASQRMPVMETIGRRLAAEQPFAGLSIGASLHITAETAVLLRALAAGGASVNVCASNPLSTNDEVAAFLVAEASVGVFARRGASSGVYLDHVAAVAAMLPDITIDDGCDLLARLHAEHLEHAGTMIGGTEDTTTGAVRLRALASAGALAYPVMTISGAKSRSLADNRHGAGQSVLDAIMRATNLLLAGARVVVAGYGNCGRGIAERARGLGAVVIVTEVDPLRALEAALDGYQVMTMREAAGLGQVFVTATGNQRVITEEHFAMMCDGAILANAGHFDVEIDLAALGLLAGGDRREVRPMVEEVVVGGRRLLLLAQGRVVNLGAADGNPAQVMDISFGVQILACEWLVGNRGRLDRAVLEVPEEIDAEVARLKLAASGLAIDRLTPAQEAYLATWSA